MTAFFARLLLSCRALSCACALFVAVPGHAKADEPLQFDIASQPLVGALKEFAAQAKMQLLYRQDAVEGATANAVVGRFEKRSALEQLLRGTGLEVVFSAENAATIRLAGESSALSVSDAKDPSVMRLSQVESGASQETVLEAEASESGSSATNATAVKVEEDSERGGIPEILVTGSRVLNMDIRRTEDDIQPYVIFDRERIERSGVSNLEEFLKNELTMDASITTATQTQLSGNRSTINLWGLGTDETLILIDGRRVAGFNDAGSPEQPDINGIPLAAVERIEVLPTTASGVFGGGATGGVINVVLRRDYAGFETQVTYGNTVKSDASMRRIDLSAGFNLEGGRTSVLLSGSYSDSDPLQVQDRNFVQRGREHLLRTNPASVFDAFMPPLGAMPNMRSLDGSNLVLDDNTPLNSPIATVPVGYAGATTDQGAALVANAGQYNLGLASTAQADGGGRYGLLAAPQVESLILTLRREFSPRFDAFLETHLSRSSTEQPVNFADLPVVLSGDAPSNPFQQTISVMVPTPGFDEAVGSESETYRVVAGVIVQLPARWQATMDFTWDRSRSSYTWARQPSFDFLIAAFSGEVDLLRDVNQFPLQLELSTPGAQSPSDMRLQNAALRMAGPLPWFLPGGEVTLSSLLEHRRESVGDTVTVCGSCSGAAFLAPGRNQSVDSMYVEALFPFISERNRRTGIRVLELQVAARADRYEVTGATRSFPLATPTPVERTTSRNSSVDPTIGLRYQPVHDLVLRASYGTGYLPPSMMQVTPSRPTGFDDLSFFGLTDPLRGNEPLRFVPSTGGGNPDLRPESSESWTAGIVLTPRKLEGLRVSADWIRIEKVDNIDSLLFLRQQDLETLITYFPERVTRGPADGGFSVGPITHLDVRLANIALMRVEAMDLKIAYQTETERLGAFGFSAQATHVLDHETQATPDAPLVQNTGVLLSAAAGTLEWKAGASFKWSRGGWTLGWRSRFFDSYFYNSAHTVDANQGAASVPSQTYHDFFGGYRFESQVRVPSILENAELQFSVNNVLNKEPPIDVVRSSSLYSPLADPRLAHYSISFRKSFGD